jgi:hypothetical protein
VSLLVKDMYGDQLTWQSMVFSYLFAQMLPTVRGRRGGGSLLVIGSANVDEVCAILV